MTQGPQAPKTLYGLQYYINPKVGADLGLPLTTNPINFSAMLENGLSANAWGVCVEKSGDIYIYCRDHMKQVKISLHKSGMQFVAFTKESDIKMTGFGGGLNCRRWPPRRCSTSARFPLALVGKVGQGEQAGDVGVALVGFG